MSAQRASNRSTLDMQIVQAGDYSAIELEAEVQRLQQRGEDTGPFEKALARLRNWTWPWP